MTKGEKLKDEDKMIYCRKDLYSNIEDYKEFNFLLNYDLNEDYLLKIENDVF